MRIEHSWYTLGTLSYFDFNELRTLGQTYTLTTEWTPILIVASCSASVLDLRCKHTYIWEIQHNLKYSHHSHTLILQSDKNVKLYITFDLALSSDTTTREETNLFQSKESLTQVTCIVFHIQSLNKFHNPSQCRVIFKILSLENSWNKFSQ